MTNRGNEPAYSVTLREGESFSGIAVHDGMTIREKIAAQHSALLASAFFSLPIPQQKSQAQEWFDKYGEITYKEAVVKDAIELTDALIEELSKPINP